MTTDPQAPWLAQEQARAQGAASPFADLQTQSAAQAGPYGMRLRPLPTDHDSRLLGPASTTHRSLVPERYLLEGLIARGERKVVFKAWDTLLDRPVAIKVPREDLLQDLDVLNSFAEEAHVASQLQQCGITPVYEFGNGPAGVPYVVSMLVRGSTLRDLLVERRSVEEDQAGLLGVFEATCRAVAYAHARGVVHANLCPENILVGAYGEVRVRGWGKARVFTANRAQDGRRLDANGQAVTSSSGNPCYMPPEIATGKLERVNEQSDVFMLGAILCEILSGAPPYTGTNEAEVLLKAAQGRLDEAFWRLDEFVLDSALLDLCKRALSGPQAARTKTAGVLVGEFTSRLASKEERTREVQRSAQDIQQRAERNSRLSRKVVLASQVAMLVVIAGAGTFFMKIKARARSHEQAVAAVNTELQNAYYLWSDARRGEGIDAERLEDARASAARAQFLLNDSIDEETANRVALLVAGLEQEESELEESVRTQHDDGLLLAQLDDIRYPDRGEDSGREHMRVGAAYAKLLRDSGLDPTGTSVEEVARRVAERSNPDDLLVALDAAAIESRRAEGTWGREAVSWLTTARTADSDLDRQHLRDLLLADDFEAVRLYRVSADWSAVPAANARLVADAFTLAGDAEGARAVLTQALGIHPQDFWLNLRLGQLIELAPVPDAAASAGRYYHTALALRPKSQEARHRLAHVMQITGDAQGALSTLGPALDEAQAGGSVDPHLLVQAGVLHGMLGDTNRASSRLREALTAEPDDAATCLWLGEILASRSEKANALAALRRGAEIDPNHAELSFALGRLLLEDFEDVEGAIAALEQAANLDPGLIDARYLLGQAYARAERFEDSIESLLVVKKADPERAGVAADLARALARTGQIGDSVQAYGEALAATPGDTDLDAELAQVLDLLPEEDGSVALLQEAVEATPQSTPLRRRLGLLQASRGDHDQAVATLSQLPNPIADPEVRDGLAQGFLSLERWDEARPLLEESLVATPDSGALHHDLGFVQIATGDVSGAVKSFRSAARLQPEVAETHYELGLALHALDETTEAETAFRRAVELDPMFAEAHCALGILLRDVSRYGEALASLQRGHDIGSAREVWHLDTLAMIDATQRMVALESRLDDYVQGEGMPTTGDERFSLAVMAERKELGKTANKLFVAALELEPGVRGQQILNSRIAAARAAAQVGTDNTRLVDEAGQDKRAAWRRVALSWLEDELSVMLVRLEKGESGSTDLIADLELWKRDTAFAGLRDSARLDELTADERQRASAFWVQVDATLERVYNK